MRPRSKFHKGTAGTSGLQPYCKSCMKDARKPKTKSQHLNHRLKQKYGLTLKKYNEMVESQGGVCSICGGTDFGHYGRLAVDHDHQTGEVRGLLCGLCNAGLGCFKDDPETMSKAVTYLLERNNQ